MKPQENYIPYSSLDTPIRQHVEAFSNVLLDKGYTESFGIDHDAITTVPAALTNGILNALNKQQEFALYYYHGDSRPGGNGVSILFTVYYTPSHGFKIGSIDVTGKNSHTTKPISIKLQPVSNQDVLSPTQCGELLTEPSVSHFAKRKPKHAGAALPVHHKRTSKS